MSPRIIHIPLSGGDRKAQAKGIRYAHGIHAVKTSFDRLLAVILTECRVN
jgi:hypothetical protein